MDMKTYRHLTPAEVLRLQAQSCLAEDWRRIMVSDGFDASRVISTRFSGDVRIGSLEGDFTLAGGITKHSGLYHVTLHNVTIGDGCCIENVNNYIANYTIGDRCFIENVDIILCDGRSTFGNGVEVCVMNETGGREVKIFDRLSAQLAYVMALYRQRTGLQEKINRMIDSYCGSVASETGTIGNDVTIADAGYIKNVRIGDCTKIEGCSRLKNGSILSNAHAPVHIGVGVIGDDFIICSGSKVEDSVMFSRCFIGQAVKLGHSYSASDSLFFANCQGENGEACAIFAGPFTVTHHKSTLLIAGMFSFMNAGSGSNQSNHMYKLGPIHQGIMERGAKTSSDSYILWPARVGAFSLVMGRHTSHLDTSNLPFSYLIENQNTTYIMPGANLHSVGTIRDAQKWPGRDGRTDPDKLDCINYNLLSPYMARKMVRGTALLKSLQEASGINSQKYSYQSCIIRKSSMEKGLAFYSMAMDKFLGNSLISRLQKKEIHTVDEMHWLLKPRSDVGMGKWIDVSGLLAPKSEVSRLLDDIEDGKVVDLDTINSRFHEMSDNYYEYEWAWAYECFGYWYGIDLSTATPEALMKIVRKWKESVVELDRILIEDASKEFNLSSMTSFGADGDQAARQADFEQVRGSSFEQNRFVQTLRNHIETKTELGREALSILEDIQ